MSLWRQFLTLLLVLTIFGACIEIGTNSGKLERQAWKLVSVAPLSSLNTNLINVITLGHRGLYDDFATIWTVQFLAESNLASKSTADEVYAAIDSVTRHHPKFESLYIIGCFTMADVFKRFDRCEKISSDGMIAFPRSYQIPMVEGVLLMNELKDNLKAAAFFQLAAAAPGSPKYLNSVAEKLIKKGFLDGQELNDSLNLLRDIPGGSKILDLMRERLKQHETAPAPGGQ